MGIFPDTLDILGSLSGTPDFINQCRALLHSPKQSAAEPQLAFFVFRYKKRARRDTSVLSCDVPSAAVDSLSGATESEILQRGLSSDTAIHCLS